MSMQTINTIIFTIGLPIVIFFAFYALNLIKQRLPEHTRLALEQFARQAVFQVEQQNGALAGPAKKELAISSVLKLFAAFNVPAPPTIAIDIAIEGAVYVLQKMYATAIESDNPPKIEPPKVS